MKTDSIKDEQERFEGDQDSDGRCECSFLLQSLVYILLVLSVRVLPSYCDFRFRMRKYVFVVYLCKKCHAVRVQFYDAIHHFCVSCEMIACLLDETS